MTDLLTFLNLASRASGSVADPPEIAVQAVSTRPGAELFSGLADAIDRASGWVLYRHMVSASAMQMRVETQGRYLMELYAGLVEQGLELSRDSHLLLAERCSCAHLHRQARSSIITLNMLVTLPDEIPLFGSNLCTQVM